MISHIDLDYDDSERHELYLERQFQRRRQQLLSAHPDCRDPDHIGCEKCDEEYDDE
jgi:hypothetical protein